MEPNQREQLLAELGDGRLKVLTSCQLIGEGVDVPSVAGCILLRPTQSVSLHLQMIGRCLRPQPGKRAVILDHVGNTQRLGHHLEDREWTLDGTPKKDREAAPSVKVCPKCFACLPSGKPRCGECGHEFTPERRELQHVDGELVEVQRQTTERLLPGDQVRVLLGRQWQTGFVVQSLPEHGKVTVRRINRDGGLGATVTTLVEFVQLPLPSSRETRREQGEARTVEDLVQIGKRRGMKNPTAWARHVMAARQNRSHAGVRG
jgi:hypothetical protein